MSYVKFWMAKQLAELLWVIAIIGIVFVVICAIALAQSIKAKFVAWKSRA